MSDANASFHILLLLRVVVVVIGVTVLVDGWSDSSTHANFPLVRPMSHFLCYVVEILIWSVRKGRKREKTNQASDPKWQHMECLGTSFDDVTF